MSYILKGTSDLVAKINANFFLLSFSLTSTQQQTEIINPSSLKLCFQLKSSLSHKFSFSFSVPHQSYSCYKLTYGTTRFSSLYCLYFHWIFLQIYSLNSYPYSKFLPGKTQLCRLLSESFHSAQYHCYSTSDRLSTTYSKIPIFKKSPNSHIKNKTENS